MPECKCTKHEPPEPSEWVDENVVAKMTGLSVQTLRNWRHEGVGFPYSKIRRSVRYHKATVREEMKKGKSKRRPHDTETTMPLRGC